MTINGTSSHIRGLRKNKNAILTTMYFFLYKRLYMKEKKSSSMFFLTSNILIDLHNMC